MSRIGDYDDSDGIPEQLWNHIAYRAIHGKPGQKVLRELEAALLALPEKRLIEGAMCEEGEVCTLGALALHRKLGEGKDRDAALGEIERAWPIENFSEYDIGEQMGMTRTLGFELVYLNDEKLEGFTPEERYRRVLDWVRLALATEQREGASA